MPLPSYAPELNSVETYGLSAQQLSQPLRLGHLRGDLDACCDAWNALMAKSSYRLNWNERMAQVKT